MSTLQTALVALGQVVVEEPDLDIEVSQGLGGSAIGAFLTTAIVGIFLVSLAPEYTERMTLSVTEEPLESFLYGILGLLGLVLLIVVLVLTIVGILLVIPLAVLIYLLWAVGSALAFLAIGERLLDESDDWKRPLLVGALLNGGLTLTGIGGVVSFCIGAAGFGAVLRDLRS